MKPRMLVWLVVCAGVVLAVSGSILTGWLAGVVVGAAVVLAIPLSIQRYRRERHLARAFWRALTNQRTLLGVERHR